MQRVKIEYKMLLSVCWLLFDGLLMTDENGKQKLLLLLPDEKMYRLYERFVREYYRYHHPEFHANASQIDWDLEAEADDTYLSSMQSDTTQTYRGKTLIIDMKWYARTMALYQYTRQCQRRFAL